VRGAMRDTVAKGESPVIMSWRVMLVKNKKHNLFFFYV
jgi:hypothetical protein